MGPCLCGDPYCPSCGGQTEPPEKCLICGAANYDEDKESFLDEQWYTCGKLECITKSGQQAAEEIQAEIAAREAEEKTEQEILAKHRKQCGRNCETYVDAVRHEIESLSRYDWENL